MVSVWILLPMAVICGVLVAAAFGIGVWVESRRESK